MEEGQKVAVSFPIDAKIIETLFTRREPIALEGRSSSRRKGQEDRDRSMTEHVGVTLLVLGVAQIEPAQARIARQLGGPRQIAPAIGLRFAEAQKLARATMRIAPDPAVKRVEPPVEVRYHSFCHDILLFPRTSSLRLRPQNALSLAASLVVIVLGAALVGASVVAD